MAVGRRTLAADKIAQRHVQKPVQSMVQRHVQNPLHSMIE